MGGFREGELKNKQTTSATLPQLPQLPQLPLRQRRLRLRSHEDSVPNPDILRVIQKVGIS